MCVCVKEVDKMDKMEKQTRDSQKSARIRSTSARSTSFPKVKGLTASALMGTDGASLPRKGRSASGSEKPGKVAGGKRGSKEGLRGVRGKQKGVEQTTYFLLDYYSV